MKYIKHILLFGLLAGILVSLAEILIDQLSGSLDLNIILQIYQLNIVVALGISLLIALFALLIARLFLSPDKIEKSRKIIFAFPLPLMLSLVIPKAFIDYLGISDLGKMGIYFGCFALLSIIHILSFNPLFNLFSARRWRWILLIILSFIMVGWSIFSAHEFTSEDQLLNYQNAKGKMSAPEPNIILIVIDALRADALPCYGNKVVKAPNIDRVAAEGVVFKQAYTALPKTLPSSCSLLTGLYPRSHGVLELGIPLRENQATMAEVLKLKGYRTAGFVANYQLNKKISGLKQGFDYYLSEFPVTAKSRAIRGKFNPLAEKRADYLTDSIIQWLEENYNSKFFIWAHFQDPHAGYDPPSPYDKMYSKIEEYPGDFKINPQLIHFHARVKGKNNFYYYISRYYGEVSFCDEQIGRLLSFLHSVNLYKNTIIIIAADHGESQGEHGKFFCHKAHNLYQENIRIPLILSFPSAIKGGKEIEVPAINIDIMPTILKLLKIESASNLPGENLLAFINGEKKERKEPILIQAAAAEGWALIKGRWKLIYQPKLGIFKLFDLIQDAKEKRDLSNKHPSIASNLRQLLKSTLDFIPNNRIFYLPRFKQLKNSVILRIKAKELIPLDQRQDLSQEAKERLKALGYIQ